MEPYLIANEAGISIFFLTLLKSFLDNTIKGEPSFHHIFLYASADFFGLVFNIIPLTNNHLKK